MPDALDMDLVREFVRDHSEAAFTELVQRHLPLVYSVARRYTGNDGDAQDVAQAVFIILTRKAAVLRDNTLLPGWLYETTRFTAVRLLGANARRHVREQEAYMQSTLNEAGTANAWEQLAPHLESAMARLRERDRALLVLRFYQNKTGPETAALMGLRENTLHKRVARALDKLQMILAKQGVTLSGEAVAGAISSSSIQAVPASLAKTVSAAALAKGATASVSTSTLAKGALKVMAWTKTKIVIIAGTVVLLAAGAATIPIYFHQAKRTRFNPNEFWATSYPTPDFNAGRHGDDDILSNTTFPATPTQLCSISGLLDECMALSGWQYLIDKNVAAGTVKFGNAKALNGQEWITAFEGVLQNGKPEWFDHGKVHKENLVLIRYSDQKIILVLPPEKAAHYQNLATETANALEKNFKPTAPGITAISPEAAFMQKSTHDLNLAKEWGLACRIFAQDHNNQLPENMAQLKNYASIQDTNWEMVSGGSLAGIRNLARTILLREREPRQAPDGTFVKAYTFADGRARLETSPDRDFTALEQRRGFLVHPARN